MIRSHDNLYTPVQLASKITYKQGTKDANPPTAKKWRVLGNLLQCDSDTVFDYIELVKSTEKEWYRPNVTQLTAAGLTRWTTYYMRRAMTINEIRLHNPDISICCCVYTVVNGKVTLSETKDVTTDEEFEQWADHCKDKYADKGVYDIQLSKDKIDKPPLPRSERFFLHNRGKGYLVSVDGTELTWSDNPMDAMVFGSGEYLALLESRKDIPDDPIKVSLRSKEENLEKPYNIVVKCRHGYFVSRDKNGFHFCANGAEAKRYPDIADGKRTAKRFQRAFNDGTIFTVERLKIL